MWKGCPTQNKFSDQLECIYICIKRASLREQVIDEEETELEGFGKLFSCKQCLEGLQS